MSTYIWLFIVCYIFIGLVIGTIVPNASDRERFLMVIFWPIPIPSQWSRIIWKTKE